MEIQESQIQARLYRNLEDLPEDFAELINTAKEACNASYSPYSKFKVGACIKLENGVTLQGSNFENASYPLCLCAERVALAAAHSLHPNVPIVSIAVTAINSKKKLAEPISPCGACRQVLAEVENKQDKPMQLILQGEEGPIYVFNSCQDILPLGFNGKYL